LHGGGIRKRLEIDTAPATPLARAWVGHRYGLQALKPALEPIIVFQKPYEGRPVDCITKTGAGALNVDGGRIPVDPAVDDMLREVQRGKRQSETWENGSGFKNESNHLTGVPPAGRWPANFCLLDEQAAAALDRQSGERPSGTWNKTAGMRPFNNNGEDTGYETIDGIRDFGGASRFFFRVTERLDQADLVFYCAKSSRAEREAGLERLPIMAEGIGDERPSGQSMQRLDGRDERKRANVHPTVKPLQLTRWLATLLLPPPEYFPRRIVIPFAGVMSEGIGASQAGWDEIVGIEREAEYVEIGRARYEHWCKSATPTQLELAEAV
jgi:site-specific DNA-methyltransferase (adenine-specific)